VAQPAAGQEAAGAAAAAAGGPQAVSGCVVWCCVGQRWRVATHVCCTTGGVSLALDTDAVAATPPHAHCVVVAGNLSSRTRSSSSSSSRARASSSRPALAWRSASLWWMMVRCCGLSVVRVIAVSWAHTLAAAHVPHDAQPLLPPDLVHGGATPLSV
jgi:hypothetical protein